MGHGASYYWKGKVPAAQFFTAVPFGLTAQEMNGWLLHGGGMELWRELYARYNLVPIAGGNTGVQMAGWFNKEINGLDDLRANWRMDKTWEPQMNEDTRERLFAGWLKAVERSLGWVE